MSNSPSLYLEPLYLNERRVTSLAGAEVVAAALGRLVPLRQAGFEKSNENTRLVTVATVLARWLLAQDGAIESFEKLWLQDELTVGRVFTVHRSFYCRNLRVLRKSSVEPRALAKYAGLGADGGEVQLHLRLNRDHLVPGSPGDLLNGQVTDLFVVAVVQNVSHSVVEAVPVFMGHRLSGPVAFMNVVGWMGREMRVGDIDSFQKIEDEAAPRSEELTILRNVPELEVKRAFAEIIGEQEIPKDWGGESSDLFTTHVEVDGLSRSAAFLFKGPARFHPMTVADLGKNGDQINRLATEPADLLVVQHCHAVTPAVRTVLRAFCNQVGDERRYCVIDGYDTLRVLRAYGKCGLTSKPVSTTMRGAKADQISDA